MKLAKTLNFKFLSILTIFILTLTSAKMPDVISFEFNGTVSTAEEALEGVEVRIFEGNEVLSTIYSDKKGRFEFELLKGSDYTLEFSKDGYVTKRMIVRTNVEEGVKKLPKLKFEIALVDKARYADAIENYPESASILDFPSAIIEYSKALGDFDYRMKYTEHILEKVKEID